MSWNTVYKYLVYTGIAVHIGVLLALPALPLILQSESALTFTRKFYDRFSERYPGITQATYDALAALGAIPPRRGSKQIDLPPFPGPNAWPEQGVIAAGLKPQGYSVTGVPLQSAARSSAALPLPATRRVQTEDEFLQALEQAQPGNRILLQPGRYRFSGRRISLGQHGQSTAPIVVTANKPGEVTLELDMLEGFVVDKAYWVFENLRIEGVCTNHSRCEHAFHVVGQAIGAVIRNNEIVDFNAALKVNGLKVNGEDLYPDFGLVQNNSIYNRTPRETGNPVNLLNINAVDGWVVSANFIADFSKASGNRVSFGAYMKGHSRRGIFERNLIVCHWQLPVQGDTRVGLSFGGGGTGKAFCREQNCDNEHISGVIRNNIIARCPVDVGIYLNRSAQTQVTHNLLIETAGIDVRFETSSALIQDNIIDGMIRNRDRGQYAAENNRLSSKCRLLARLTRNCRPQDWYQAPLTGDFRLKKTATIRGTGTLFSPETRDFCNQPRISPPDLGPIDYSADGNASCLPSPAEF